MYLFFRDLAIILIAAKFFGLIARKLKAPQVVGEIIAGLLIGPSLLGVVQLSDTISVFAEIGVILLMFSTGLGTNLKQLMKAGPIATLVACVGVFVPLVGGTLLYGAFYGLGAIGSPEFYKALFIGTIMTATSVSITVATLQELGQLKGFLGTTIVSAAVIDDVIGIVVLTCVLGAGSGEEGGTSIGQVLINTVLFFVVAVIVGSAAGQGVVALIGFWIAGVPGAITLGVAVFVLSAVPIGPPLVWGPAAFWLYYKGEVGMAIFLVLWGSLAVSSVDNFLKPILISKGASLPLSLIYLGVFGGVLAFGFMGIILGPVVIAVGIAMSKTWLSVSATVNDKDQPTAKTETVLKKLSKNSIESDIVSDVTGEQRSSNHHHYSQPKNDGQK